VVSEEFTSTSFDDQTANFMNSSQLFSPIIFSYYCTLTLSKHCAESYHASNQSAAAQERDFQSKFREATTNNTFADIILARYYSHSHRDAH